MASVSLAAIRDLRNIPEDVVLSLLQERAFTEALLSGPAILSFPVFEYLWNTSPEKSHNLFNLVRRHLTPPQRQLALKDAKCHKVLAPLLEHNILTLDELKIVPINMLASSVDRVALRYYLDDPAVMEYVFLRLPSEVACSYLIHSSTPHFSDDYILHHIRHYVKKHYHVKSVVNNAVVADLQDLIRYRPHLVTTLATLDNQCVQVAVATSPHAGTPETLLAMLGVEGPDYEKAGAYHLESAVRSALAHNPWAPLDVRYAMCPDIEPNNVFPGSIDGPLREITDPEAITMLVDRAVSMGQTFGDTEFNSWDTVDLSESPFLNKEDARRLVAHWTGSHRDENARRVGYERAYQVYLALNKKAELPLGNGHLFEDSIPGRATFRYTEPLDDVPWDIDIEETLGVEFLGNAYATRSAAVLTAILGEKPYAWSTFFRMLDCAPHESSIKEVATTSARLVCAQGA